MGAGDRPRPTGDELDGVTDRLVEVRVAVPDAETGERLARALVEARLAACAQLLGPMTSTYWWQGRMESAREHLLLVKTVDARFGPICEMVRSEHPYDNPEILALEVADAAPPYAAWLRETLTHAED